MSLLSKLKSLLLFSVVTGFLAAPSFAGDNYLTDASLTSVPGTTLVDNAAAHALFEEGVVFIDVRSQMAFDKGRIPDAVFLDLETSFTREALANEVSPEDPVVIYCQGPKCERAAVAAQKAVEFGYKKVYYYRDGFPGWQQAGYPVE